MKIVEQKDLYDIKIADYLDGKMAAAGEEAFMLELSENEALRQQYEDELTIRDLLQPAPEEVAELTAPVVQMPAKNVNRFRTYYIKWSAAAILLLIAAGAIVILQKNKQNPDIAVTPIPPVTDTFFVKDTATNIATQEKVTPPADSLFKKYYRTYTSENDPVEISNYYQEYKSGNYKNILAATSKDYQLRGGNNRDTLLLQYMNFYQGLSYLAQNNAKKALERFYTAQKMMKQNEPPFYDVQWYTTLAFIQLHDTKSAGMKLKKVSMSASPYKTRADKLSDELSNY